MPNIYALLIGIDDYDDRWQNNIRYGKLKGCVRDIEHVYAYLRSDLQVPEDNINRLTAPLAGKGEPVGDTPTYDGIVGGFFWLLSKTQPEDHVYIHFSGHGGRARTDKPELKQGFNYDETLVPVDIGSPNGTYLRDYEINLLFKMMVEKGLVVTAVFDSCHSGGANRGDALARGIEETDEGARPKGSKVGSDEAIALAWSGSVGEARGLDVESYNWLANPQKYTFVAACYPHEKAQEYPFTTAGNSGALTHFWLDTLRKSPANSSHRMVMDRVIACVHGQFGSQTPMLQGIGDTVLFGEEVRKRRANIGVLDRRPGSDIVRLGAGLAHGIEKGASVELYKFNADLSLPGDRSADAEADEVSAVECTARIVRTYGDRAIETGDKALFPGATSVKLQIPVRVLLEGDDKTKVERAIAEMGRGFVKVAQDEAAEMLVGPVVGREGIYVLDKVDEPLFRVPSIATLDAESLETLVERMVHVARYWQVQRLAPANDKAAAMIEVTVDGTEGTAITCSPEQDVLVQIKNILPPGATANANNIMIDILVLQSDWSITQYPLDEGTRTLAPGESRPVLLGTSLAPSQTRSVDYLKVFATRTPSTFEWLQLNALDGGDRSMEGSRDTRGSNPLDSLIELWERGEVLAGTRDLTIKAPPQAEWTTVQIEVTVQ